MELLTVYVPWIGSVLAECVLIGIMFHRGMVRRFPWFFASVVYDVLRQGTIAAIVFFHPQNHSHFYAYWISIPIEYTFAFAVIYEVFRKAFQPELSSSTTALRVFISANVVLLLVAAAFVFTGELPFSNFAWLMLILDRSAEFMRCGMLLFLWAFAAKLKITWRDHLWGIILGLGLYSAVGLITAAVDVATGRMCSYWLAPIPHFAYLLATIIWPIYLWKPEPAHEPLTLEQINVYRELLAFVRDASLQMRRALRDDS
jgi:hypothetical protein